MKVISIINFDLDIVNDKLLKNNINQEEENKIAEDYNNYYNENWDYYVIVKDDNYNIYEFNT